MNAVVSIVRPSSSFMREIIEPIICGQAFHFLKKLLGRVCLSFAQAFTYEDAERTHIRLDAIPLHFFYYVQASGQSFN